jgi:hypothetical protein
MPLSGVTWRFPIGPDDDIACRIIYILNRGFTWLSIKKNTIDLLNIYFGKLCHHREIQSTDDGVICRNIH